MRWEELSVPEIERARPRPDRGDPAARFGRAARPPHAGRHRHDARPFGLRSQPRTGSRAASPCCRRPGTDSPRITCALPAPSRCGPRRMMALVEDIAASVVAHGFRRLLIVNGHGGNNGVIDVLASTLGHRSTERRGSPASPISSSPREAIAELRESRPGGMGHACEFETSMMQHVRPDLVAMEQRRGDLSRSRLALPDDRSSRRLGGPHLSRFRRPLGKRHARRPVARHAREGRRASTTRCVGELVRFIEDFSAWKIPMQPTGPRGGKP